jgi:hypothetical protein
MSYVSMRMHAIIPVGSLKCHNICSICSINVCLLIIHLNASLVMRICRRGPQGMHQRSFHPLKLQQPGLDTDHPYAAVTRNAEHVWTLPQVERRADSLQHRSFLADATVQMQSTVSAGSLRLWTAPGHVRQSHGNLHSTPVGYQSSSWTCTASC